MNQLKRKNNSGRKQPAATLIEVIAFIALTALLFGQAVPSLRDVRDGARRAECISKIGAIVRARHICATIFFAQLFILGLRGYREVLV